MSCFEVTTRSHLVSLDLNVSEEEIVSDVIDDEVLDEELDEGQEKWYKKLKEDYDNVVKQLENLQEVGEVVAKADSTVAVRLGGDSAPCVLPNSIQINQPIAEKNSTGNRTVVPQGQPILAAQPSTTTPRHIQAMPPGGVILQSPATLPGNIVRPPGNGPPPPPGTYQLVVDPRVGGFFVGAVATGIPNTGVSQAPPTYRAPVPPLQKTTQLRTQAVTVPVNKNILVTPTTVNSGVLLQKAVNKTQTWAPTTPIVTRVITTGSNSIGSVIASTSAGPLSAIPLRPSRGRPPKYTHVLPNVGSRGMPSVRAGLGPRMPVNQIRPRGMPNQIRPGMPVTGIRAGSSVNGPSLTVSNGARSMNSTPALPDSREVNFNRLGVGKTFPSLVVVAKPTMRSKEFSASVLSKDRSELDHQVKELLLNSMTKLTEWLIQQGLVRSSQVCQTHRSAATSEPVNLKLGMYSEVSKFPYSGGYVWICEFCPTQLFVSVFSGSIFEGAPHPPLVLLKLIYHWACQTTSSNIVAWVKVESFYVKMFFTHMRAVCTAAVHENYELLGGPNKRVEVGVISLGTAAQDGSTRNVKVEVLGVMDPENKLIRLRAVEPLQEGEKNYKRRFVKILEPLAKWVHKKSTILTDFTVDKGTLHNMGFSTVYQVSVNPDNLQDKTSQFSNINVMNYLRRVVPGMFQNTLSLLSRQIIQQFLDELVWRERWGPVASQAFNNIIKHIAEQTRANKGSSFLRRLGKISDDPFRDWKYSVEEDIQIISTTPPAPASAPVPSVAPAPAVNQAPGPASKKALGAIPPAPHQLETTRPVSPPATGLTPGSSMSVSPPLPEILRPSIDMLPLGIRELDNDPVPFTSSGRGRGRKRPTEPLYERPRKRTGDSYGPRRSTTLYSTLVVGAEESTSLQAYYYGTLEGDPVAANEEKKELPVLKCCVCVRRFTNNIQLMKHLILHSQISQFSSELSDVTQCKYCLKTFPTPFSMQSHLEEVHLTSGNNDICMICTEKFKDTTTLIAHMHRTHVALEMPYICHVCQYRSSIHRDLIDHFYEVHNNGEKMQCPFCLKTVAVCANGRKLGSNISFFLTHIQKHQRRSVVKKCTRCALWFVNKWAIRDHLQRDHVSFKDVAGVKPALPDTGEEIRMPLPPAELGPSATLSAVRRGSNFPNRGCHSTTYLLPALLLDEDISDNSCIECKEAITDTHYPGYSMCSRCRFATCCPKAMKTHMNAFHETYDESPFFDIGTPVNLTEPLHCVCGFTSDSGNRLAKHLALCDKKSAYPNADRAKAATVQSASFPPLVTLDDADNNGEEDPSDKWLKAFVPARREDSESSRDAPEKKSTGADTHSMLNVLGLVRKPSTDDSSLDKAPSDKEDSTEAPITASA